jgi:hypothetical protein
MIFCKIGTAVWITMSTVAMAQTGGYPASLSQGIVGAPRPDGLLRYGKQPGAIKCNGICAKSNGRFGETFGVSCVCAEGETIGG